ncbi:MAG: putative lipid II flippase FtsW [Pseudomonadota bacterium]
MIIAARFDTWRQSGTRAAGRAHPALDPWLLGSATALIALGIVMVYSASVAYAERMTGHGLYFLSRHLAHLAIALLAMLVVYRLRVRVWERLGPYLLLAGIVLLCIVLLPGIGASINGSSRWIRLGVFSLQPSELMKLFVVVYVAGYLVRRQEELLQFTRGILMVGLVVAVIGMLLLQEPDLGSVAVICATVMTMLFLGGVRFWHFGLVLLLGFGGMVLLTVFSPYRMGRVTSFLDPWADPFGSGFQLTQALIAVGRGEWFGAGLGASVQKLSYLPAAHTDFVFAVTAEEFGLLGVFVVMGLYAIVILRAFAIARAAELAGQIYAARLAQGLGLLLGVQAIINIGVNLGALPTKGLTLPFVSYGGSSLIVCAIALAILLRIGREAHAQSWGRAAT